MLYRGATVGGGASPPPPTRCIPGFLGVPDKDRFSFFAPVERPHAPVCLESSLRLLPSYLVISKVLVGYDQMEEIVIR